jgi:hypothetical protein
MTIVNFMLQQMAMREIMLVYGSVLNYNTIVVEVLIL